MTSAAQPPQRDAESEATGNALPGDPAGFERAEMDRLLRPTLWQYFILQLSRLLVFSWLLPYSRMWVWGRRNIPKSGAFLLVSNHLSHLDPLVVGIACYRPCTYMARDTLFDGGFVGWWMRTTRAFAVKREGADRKSLRLAIELLKRGHPVVIFPEGTRSRDGKPQKAMPGAAMVAAMAGDFPIVPMRLEGTWDVLPPKTKVPRPARIRVVIGKPFRLSELQGMPEDKRAFYQAVADEMMARIATAQP